jgi:hypothetical protein
MEFVTLGGICVSQTHHAFLWGFFFCLVIIFLTVQEDCRNSWGLTVTTHQQNKPRPRVSISLFYVPLKNFSLVWLIDYIRLRLRPAQESLTCMETSRDLYRATPAVTQDLGFYGLIRRTAPFSRLLRHARGCGGSILTWILTGTYMETHCWEDSSAKLWFFGLIRRTVPFNRLFWLGRGRGSILIQSLLTTSKGMLRTFSNPDSQKWWTYE